MAFAHRLRGFAAWAAVSFAALPAAWGAAGPTINANDRIAECRNPYVSIWLNPTVTSSVDPLPSVTFSNRVSTDASGFPTNTDPDNYPVGPRTVTINACDHSTPTKNCSTKTVNVTVRDTLGPKVTIAANKTAQCVSPSGTPAAPGYCADTCRTSACDPNTASVCQPPNQSSSACTTCNTQYNNCVSTTCPQDTSTVHLDKPVITDACDPSPSSSNNAPVAPFMFPIGKTIYGIRSSDYSGNVTNQNVTVQVVDTVAPKFDAATVPPFNVASQATSGTKCVIGGGVFGTPVTLTHPNATDVCTDASKVAYSWRVGGGVETTNPAVCMPDGTNTVQFVARDAAGNTDTMGGAAAKTTTVTVAPQASFPLTITVDNTATSTNFVKQGVVKATLTGSTGAVTWNLVGATAPDNPPGSTTNLNVTYSSEGSYCPVYISAQDSSATPKGGATLPPCFAVDRTLPSHVFAGLPATSDPLGSVVSAGAQMPLEITASDSNGVVPSGIAKVNVYARSASNANTMFYSNTYCGGPYAAGVLPNCPSTRRISGCNQVGTLTCPCTGTTAGECSNGDGRIDVSAMQPGSYNMIIEVTDLAGNTNTTQYPFSVASLPTALVNDPNNPVGGLAALLNTQSTTNSSLTARPYFTLAKQYVQSAGSIFYESPGQALLLLRQAWTQLDTARSNGANVTAYQNFLANIAEGEVRRMVVAVATQYNTGNLSTWNFLDDRNTQDRYKNRAFLTYIGGTFRDYAVAPNSTLNLAAGYLALTVQHIGRGETSQAIDRATQTYDSLSTLFQDATFSTMYGYAPHQVDVGTSANPNLIPENYFKQGIASHFGTELGRTVASQIARFSARAQGGALFGVSASTIATLASVTSQINTFTNTLTAVQNQNWNVADPNAGFSNRKLVQNVYLPAVTALQNLQTLSGANIYTRYWQTGLGLTLADVVNFSMYEGPTALSCILLGSDDDSTATLPNDNKFQGCSQIAASNAPAIYQMDGTKLYGKAADWEAQVAECRYSRMLYALGDGRLLGNNAGALDLFVQSKCNIINLYNRYYAGRSTRFIADDTPIDPNAYACPTTAATFSEANAIAACGGCNVPGNTGAPNDTTCDGIDDDCNGLVDDGVAVTTCGCGSMTPTYPGYVCPCQAASACYNGQALPCVPKFPIASVDTTCSKIDYACTGSPGAGYVPSSCGVGGCVSYSMCSNGTETACTPKPAGTESCNGADDNCNITVDEGLDNDLDGYGCAPCTLYTTSAACTAQQACSWSGSTCTGAAACTRCDPTKSTCTAPLFCAKDTNSSGAWTGVWDCNDQDSTVFPGNPEVCDGKDNNCNGQVDEGVLNACGDCNPSCQGTLIGRGGSPFNPTSVNATNIAQNPNGDLGLTTQNLNLQFAWIANDTAGTISKLDMTSGKEVARYCQAIKTGVTSFASGKDPTGATYDTRAEPTVCAGCGGCNNGSRTAVDKSGNMIIANRAYSDNGYVGTYSKVAGNVSGCVDVNGDGVIQTSSDKNGDGVIDPNQSLPTASREYWGELDECILYTRKPVTWDVGLKQPSCNQLNWPPNDTTKDPNGTSYLDEMNTCLNDPNTNDPNNAIGPNGVCQWVNACNGSGDTTCSSKTTMATCITPLAGGNPNNCQWGSATCTGVSGCSGITSQTTCNSYVGYCTWQSACSPKPCANNANNMVACKAQTGCSWNMDCYNMGDGPLTNVAYPMPRSMTIDAGGDAWVGLFNRQAFVQVNTQNGYIKRYAYTGYSPYGSSLDQYGILWHGDSCCQAQYLAGLNTNPNTVVYKNPDNGNTTFTWKPYGTQASATKSPNGSYGVATDRKGYVYIGSYGNGGIVNAGFRFDAYRNSWTNIPASKDSKGNVLVDAGIGRGTAVGADGTIWIAQMGTVTSGSSTSLSTSGGRVTGFNPNTLLPTVDVDFGSKGKVPIGVGVGYAGRIWTSNQTTNNVSVVDPTTGSVGYYPVGGPPYCYSDFTGAVLRTFTSPTGSYQEVIDACYGFPVSSWVSLQWSGIQPIGTSNQGRNVNNTSLQFRVRGTNKLVTRDSSGNPVDPGTASQWSLWFPDDASDPNKSTSDPNRVYYYSQAPSSQWPSTGPCAGLNSSTLSGSSYYVNACSSLAAVPTTYTFDSTGPQPIAYLQVQAVLLSDSDNTVQPTLINFQIARTCPQF